MRWADIPRNPAPRQLRMFSMLLFAGLIVLGVMRGLSPSRDLILWLAWDAATWLALIGVIWPRVMRPLFVGWMIAAFPIGWAVSHAVLALVYFGIVTPLALVFRLIGRDALHRRRPSDLESYWHSKPVPKGLQSYFQQF